MIRQAGLERLVCKAKPKECHSSAGDQVLALPVVEQQFFDDGQKAPLYADGPGFVPERFVGNGVGPEYRFSNLHRGLKAGAINAVIGTVKAVSNVLAAFSYKGLAVLDFSSSRVAPKDSQGALESTGSQQHRLGDWDSIAFVDGCIDGHVTASGFPAKGLSERFHGFSASSFHRQGPSI